MTVEGEKGPDICSISAQDGCPAQGTLLCHGGVRGPIGRVAITWAGRRGHYGGVLRASALVEK